MNTPWPMLGYVRVLHAELIALAGRLERLEIRIAKKSANSKRLSSSDCPSGKHKTAKNQGGKPRKGHSPPPAPCGEKRRNLPGEKTPSLCDGARTASES